MEKIPVTIITGFLGAGKTTLTRHLLASCSGKRMAVVVNEFGDMGVDGDLLRACGIEGCGDEDIVELANGCICCTVADDFLPVMRRLLAREDAPEHILIETSGLALPKPLVSAFLWPEVRTRCSVDGVIAVVDADAVASGRFAADVDALDLQRSADESLNHETPLEELFEEQVGCADILLLNKVDLLEEDALESVREQCALHLRPQARMVEASQGEVDTRIVLGLEIAAEEDLDSRPSHHDGEEEHNHDDFENVVLEFGEFASVEDVLASVGRLLRAQEVLRVKGFVSVAGRSMRLVVQAVGPRVEHYFGGEWGVNEERVTRLVVIGEVGLDVDVLRSAFLGFSS